MIEKLPILFSPGEQVVCVNAKSNREIDLAEGEIYTVLTVYYRREDDCDFPELLSIPCVVVAETGGRYKQTRFEKAD
ncbi:MAG: hypothetical protein KGI54_15780 [Pseudomonadota bacterium]|nr:hypothetical protein [Pseudomonadota bacterium]